MKTIFILTIILFSNMLFAQGKEDIFKFVKNNDTKATECLDKVKNINAKDQFDCDIFTYALANRNFELAKKILEKGYDINNKDIFGNTLLHNIIFTNDIKTIQFLIENKININLKNNSGNTPLHLASQNANVTYIYNPELFLNRLLIARLVIHNKILSQEISKEESNQNQIIKMNISPLLNAILTGDLEGLKLIIKKVNDLNKPDIYGMTYLDWAVMFEKKDIKNFLIENRALSKENNLKMTEIFFEPNLDIYKLLLKNGADVNSINRFKIAPVHLVCIDLNVEKLKLLIENNVTLNNKTNKWRFSPLHPVSIFRYNDPIRIEIIKILLENGTNPEEPQYHHLENLKTDEPKYKQPTEYNLKIIISEENIDNPKKDLRSYYKIFINKEEKGRTNVALESQNKEYKIKLDKNKHLLEIEKYRLDMQKGKYIKLNNINQPKPDHTYFEIPDDKIVLIQIINDKKNNRCEYKIDFEME